MDAIEEVKLFLSIVNIILTVGLLLAAWIGLMGTQDQLEKARHEMTGATLYNMARDGRELMRLRRERRIGSEDFLSYFHACYLLYMRGVLDEAGWSPISEAYKDIIRSDKGARSYLYEHAKYYDKGFIDFSKTVLGDK